MAKKKLILFDFDGTIANTFKISKQVVNDRAEELGFKRLTDEEIEKLRGMTAKEIFEYVKISFYRLPKLILLYHKEMTKVITKARPIEGVPSILNKLKKRNYRQLWIARINAAVREEGMTYSQFMNKLSVKGIDLDRKVLSDLAMNNPETFKQLIAEVK